LILEEFRILAMQLGLNLFGDC